MYMLVDKIRYLYIGVEDFIFRYLANPSSYLYIYKALK